jgi:hypothetical protein
MLECHPSRSYFRFPGPRSLHNFSVYHKYINTIITMHFRGILKVTLRQSLGYASSSLSAGGIGRISGMARMYAMSTRPPVVSRARSCSAKLAPSLTRSAITPLPFTDSTICSVTQRTRPRPTAPVEDRAILILFNQTRSPLWHDMVVSRFTSSLAQLCRHTRFKHKHRHPQS